ncbi:hypothetical protein HBH92_077960 [Parastagonospora nodorum]|nr:hypothetical protein HBH92_077960 [Parastagonospora nodorum]KAH4440769.1 hypothetical protein HBH93_083350 [Parastagonospora nodorum]KAH4451455.1 hypothetical protein HBH91_111580 [Parastagonospora nodorum]KAH4509056.1 hypothetical protein HBH89_063050 [Parastagonospora nodorum]KAH4547064.1 hypothetical protein HBH85_069370 [Parastagonospora nodorum]
MEQRIHLHVTHVPSYSTNAFLKRSSPFPSRKALLTRFSPTAATAFPSYKQPPKDQPQQGRTRLILQRLKIQHLALHLLHDPSRLLEAIRAGVSPRPALHDLHDKLSYRTT